MNDLMKQAYECLITKLQKQIRDNELEYAEQICLWLEKENKIFDVLMKKLGYKTSHGLAQMLDDFHKEQAGKFYGHVACFEERYEHLEPKEKK